MKESVNVDLSSASDVLCESCSGNQFVEIALIKRISPLVSPTGKEAIIPIQTFACRKCGHINKDFDPTGKLGSK